MIYFTSDTHFGHKNIIKYCNRPFKNIEEMGETIINNWNSIVNPNDTVYHLGDFCFGSSILAHRYFNRLKGRIYILKNSFHHDGSWIDSFIFSERIGSLEPIVALEFPKYSTTKYPKPIILCHYPIYIWDRKHYLSWHLYGHVHHKEFSIPNSPLSMNVGVDCNNFFPVSLESVAEKFLEIEKNMES